MIYAPVVIPTLNRYEHFIRCVESLRKNTWAHKTELFISLDYPPNEKYAEGYKKIREYLKQNFEEFKACHIYIQEDNLGAFANMEFLKDAVASAGYDRYIFSEDDNEFSLNFIEYMDKCLDYFENDNRVIAVTGTQKKGDWETLENNVILQNICPAYGLGLWINKTEVMMKELQGGLITEIGQTPELIKRLKNRNKLCFYSYICYIIYSRNNIFWENDKVRFCDTVCSIYATATEKYIVAPVVGKVRNWGFDGSGVNMKAKAFNPVEEYPLDGEKDFNLTLTKELYLSAKNVKILDRQLSVNVNKNIKAIVLYWIYLLLGKDYRKCIKLKRLFHIE